MSTDPDQIREEIRRTRESLSSDMDALAYKASPGRVVQERADRVRGMIHSVREKVMGTAGDVEKRAGATAAAATSATTSALSDAASSVAGAASTVAETAAAVPGQLKRAAEGNPLAAGMVVFGAAWLVSSMLPGSNAEQQAAGQVKAVVQDHLAPLADTVDEVAHEMRDHLREPVQEAVESMKSTMTDAVHTVRDDGVAAAEGIRHDLVQARDEITS